MPATLYYNYRAFMSDKNIAEINSTIGKSDTEVEFFINCKINSLHHQYMDDTFIIVSKLYGYKPCWKSLTDISQEGNNQIIIYDIEDANDFLREKIWSAVLGIRNAHINYSVYWDKFDRNNYKLKTFCDECCKVNHEIEIEDVGEIWHAKLNKHGGKRI